MTVVICGGTLNPRTLSTASQQTLGQLSEVFADRLFLATYGVHFEKGLAERSFEVAETKRALIASAREITLVCNSSKFGSAGPVLISPLTAVKRVISDNAMPAHARDWFASNRISVELVSSRPTAVRNLSPVTLPANSGTLGATISSARSERRPGRPSRHWRTAALRERQP